jgi:hypothetical protein
MIAQKERVVQQRIVAFFENGADGGFDGGVRNLE